MQRIIYLIMSVSSLYGTEKVSLKAHTSDHSGIEANGHGSDAIHIEGGSVGDAGVVQCRKETVGIL